ncbi:hypothetical protein J6TS1_01990 [Siminovitchia terrae]|uniref:Uncharacterized protein n=1 Tax=Siminovitchia terrae TaxID=1914933 RepID=A0ABQ4KRR9_SIMTE|nr:hypothetical protein J22TS1_12100 [Siminovitchia terrae]GIN94329.1 hypothetical protein J6TS1_01990 [Siminovitchia terrae]
MEEEVMAIGGLGETGKGIFCSQHDRFPNAAIKSYSGSQMGSD